MDNPSGTGTEIQPNPPLPSQPMSATVDLYVHNLCNFTNYDCFYFPQSQNPNHHTDYDTLNSLLAIQPVRPGGVPVQPHANIHVSSSGFDAHHHISFASAPHYQYSNQSYGIMNYGDVTNKVTTANPGSVLWTNQTIGSQRSSAWKKAFKKKQIVQSAWCEVCRIDCNSKIVLDQHKLGKKHKNNLQKRIVANASVLAPSPVSASAPPAASTVSNNPVIGPQENPVKAKCASSQSALKKPADAKDLENKRKKVLEGGAAVDAVRTCAICNVVCNSDTVFRYHLQGQKHATVAMKHANATGLAAETENLTKLF